MVRTCVAGSRTTRGRTRAQLASAEKEENRTAPRASRVEMALSSNLEEAESVEARETPDQDHGGCREGVSTQENVSTGARLQNTKTPNLFSQTISNGSCMKARLGTVSSINVRMSRGLPQGAPESPVIFTMIMELVLRDLIKSWTTRKLAWRLDDFALAAICNAGDVVLVAVSMSAAEVMVTEVIAKLKEVGQTVGAQKTLWTRYPKMMDKNIMVDGLAVLWEEVLEFVGSKVLLGRESKTCDRTQICSSQQMSGEAETCSEFFMALQIVAFEHCKD